MVDVSENNEKATGGCLCGAVRYKIFGDLRAAVFMAISVLTPASMKTTWILLKSEVLSGLNQ